MKSVGYCHSEERSDVGIRSLRLADENNGLPRRPIGPPRNDKALQSVPIQNLRKIPVFFKYRHNKQPNMTALCNDTFYHGMKGFSRGKIKRENLPWNFQKCLFLCRLVRLQCVLKHWLGDPVV